MATITTFISVTQEHLDLSGRAIGMCNTLNFDTTNVAASDVVQAIKIPANALVTRVSVIVRTAEGGTCTATVGDGTDADGWDVSSNFNAAANTVTVSTVGTDALAVGKFYASADTIDFTMSNAAATGKVTIVAEYSMVDR